MHEVSRALSAQGGIGPARPDFLPELEVFRLRRIFFSESCEKALAGQERVP